jgi:hypothetical protein
MVLSTCKDKLKESPSEKFGFDKALKINAFDVVLLLDRANGH